MVLIICFDIIYILYGILKIYLNFYQPINNSRQVEKIMYENKCDQ